MKSASSSASWGSCEVDGVEEDDGVWGERFLWDLVDWRLDALDDAVVVVRRLRSSAEKQSRRMLEFVDVISSVGMIYGLGAEARSFVCGLLGCDDEIWRQDGCWGGWQ